MIEKENKQQVDILADLFNESTGESPQGLEKLCELTYRKQPSSGIRDESESQGGISRNHERKTKVNREFTYSISKRKVVEDGAPKVKIKIMVPKRIEQHVPMSKIVDNAIEFFLEELKSAVEE